jgi:putative membrane protein
MMHWGNDWSSLWWWMPVGMIVLWVVVVAAVVLVVRELALRSQSQDADAALGARYARGEIDDEEYRHRRSVLRGRRG